jgi:hypothetical protein
MGRLEMCCCCCTIKGGLCVLGTAETLFMVISILAMAYEVNAGSIFIYDYLVFFVYPLVVELPKVVAFFALICTCFKESTRKFFYKVRLYSLILGFALSTPSFVYGFFDLRVRYDLDDCNPRKEGEYTQNHYTDYENQRLNEIKMEGKSSLIEFKDYEDWVHMGTSADECALLTSGSIWSITFLALILHIHFVFVAKAFHG